MCVKTANVEDVNRKAIIIIIKPSRCLCVLSIIESLESICVCVTISIKKGGFDMKIEPSHCPIVNLFLFSVSVEGFFLIIYI